MMHQEYGLGGLLTLDAGTVDKANELMEMMQQENLGYLAVSLGFIKHYSLCSGSSTHLKFLKKKNFHGTF